MGRTLEEIDAILSRKDEKIKELEAQIRHLTYVDEWAWRQLRQLSDAENMGLPTPRLEIRHRRVSDYTHFIDYGLVIRHFLGHIEFVPLSSTKVSGGGKDIDVMYLPYRDGAHIYNEMFELNLRGFVVDGEHINIGLPRPESRELLLTDPDVPYRVAEKLKKV